MTTTSPNGHAAAVRQNATTKLSPYHSLGEPGFGRVFYGEWFFYGELSLNMPLSLRSGGVLQTFFIAIIQECDMIQTLSRQTIFTKAKAVLAMSANAAPMLVGTPAFA